jgi:hypothetical protein
VRNDVIVYIDHSDVREGSTDDLKAGVARLVDFIRERERQLIHYSFHFDEAGTRMTVTAVHPDAASLELHMEVGAAEFRKLAGFLSLRSIEIYGTPSEKALGQMHDKLAALGGGGTLTVQSMHAGFTQG